MGQLLHSNVGAPVVGEEAPWADEQAELQEYILTQLLFNDV